MKQRKFLGNTVFVDVDGLRGVNRYTVEAVYDVPDEDGFYSLKFEPVDEFEMTWKEIERDGGVAQVNRDLEEVYGPDPFKR